LLRLLDAKGNVKAVVRSDASGRFSFPPLPNGRYRVDTPSLEFYDEIDISGKPSTACRKREILLFVPAFECGSGGYILRPPPPDPSIVRGNGLKP